MALRELTTSLVTRLAIMRRARLCNVRYIRRVRVTMLDDRVAMSLVRRRVMMRS